MPRAAVLTFVATLALAACSGASESARIGTEHEPGADTQSGPGRIGARPGRGGGNCAPGEHTLRLGSGRTALMRVTPGSGTRGKALVLVLHGAGGGSRDGLYAFRGGASTRGLVLVAPASGGSTWSLLRGGQDVDLPFVDQSLARAFSRCRIDPRRVGIGGFSDGATYALTLGLMNGDLFRAVMALSPGGVLAENAVGKPRVFVAHGSRDTILAQVAHERCHRPRAARVRLPRDVSQVLGRARGAGRRSRAKQSAGSCAADAAYDRSRGGAAARLVRDRAPRPSLAPDSRPVRDPRQRGHAPADAGRAGRASVPRLARALADRGIARRSLSGRRDPRVAGPRVQPPRPQPPSGGDAHRRARLAGRSDRAAGRGAVHRRCASLLRVRRGRPARRRERRACLAAHRPHVLGCGGSGAHGSRRDGLPRACAALCRVPARRRVPLARNPRRAHAQAGAVRGLVPPAASGDAQGSRRVRTRARCPRRRSRPLARAGRARRRHRRPGRAPS